MRAYIITTGAVFVLLFLAHIARIFAEGWHVVMNPWFVLTTAAAGGLSLWALRLLKLSMRS